MQHRPAYLASLSLLLVACATNAPAPVLDISDDPANFAQTGVPHSTKSINKGLQSTFNHSDNQLQGALTHKVMAGETLFSIAWRYSLDFNQLAQINQVENYKIYPGEVLLLKDQGPALQPGLKHDQPELFNSGSLVAAINQDFLHKPALSVSAKDSQLAKIQAQKKHKTLNYPSNAKVISHSASRRGKQDRQIVGASSSKVKRWIWPVNGRLIGRFSNKLNMNKGLDIAAKRGTPVRATAGGKVVYSGSGLRGYGQLVIIKHNDAYLSAYAHNDKIHVQENEYVKAGQRIADLGSSDSDNNKLHFEIRYKGKPVDPLKYLPKTTKL